MAARLHLLVPGLFGPFPPGVDVHPHCPNLEHLLARGDFHQAAPTPYPAHLAQLFSLDKLAAGPVCHNVLAEAGQAEEGVWFRADPVQLLLGQNNLYLLAWEELALQPGEAETLIAALNEFHREDGWHWRLIDPQRWLVRIPAPFELDAEPTIEVIQRDLREAAPTGADTLRWRSRLAELEMLLHAHPVNQARLDAGQPVVNSLWLWGGGDTLPQPARRFTHIAGGDCLLQGLAGLSGAVHQAGTDVETALQQTAGVGLLQPLDLRLPVRRGDIDTWKTGIETLERDWFGPLARALGEGGLDELTVDGCGATLRISRSALRRWWRRRRPLARWCQA